MSDVAASLDRSSIPPVDPNPAAMPTSQINGNGEAAFPTADTPAAAPTPSSLPANGTSTATTARAPTPGTVSLDEEQKLQMVAGMDPQKVLSIRRVSISMFDSLSKLTTTQRVQELLGQGHTKESSSELGKMQMVLDLYARAKALE